MTILTGPTSLSQWLALLNEAELAAAIQLQENLESYLAFMLIRFSKQPEIIHTAVGLEFLSALDNLSHLQDQKLQEVGDKCLIFSGLFPENAPKRRVSMNYYIDLGQTAYHMLSHHHDFTLYDSLCHQFVMMRDVLDAMRDNAPSKHPNLFAYFDLWTKHKSTYALKKLQASHLFFYPTPPSTKQ